MKQEPKKPININILCEVTCTIFLLIVFIFGAVYTNITVRNTAISIKESVDSISKKADELEGGVK